MRGSCFVTQTRSIVLLFLPRGLGVGTGTLLEAPDIVGTVSVGDNGELRNTRTIAGLDEPCDLVAQSNGFKRRKLIRSQMMPLGASRWTRTRTRKQFSLVEEGSKRARWIAISETGACQDYWYLVDKFAGRLKPTCGDSQISTIGSCQACCILTAFCVAIDFFRNSTSCFLYTAACPDVEATAAYDGASSFRVLSFDQMTPDGKALIVTTTTASTSTSTSETTTTSSSSTTTTTTVSTTTDTMTPTSTFTTTTKIKLAVRMIRFSPTRSRGSGVPTIAELEFLTGGTFNDMTDTKVFPDTPSAFHAIDRDWNTQLSFSSRRRLVLTVTWPFNLVVDAYRIVTARGSRWVLDRKTCDVTCGGVGLACDHKTMTSITTEEQAIRAFSEAGHFCENVKRSDGLGTNAQGACLMPSSGKRVDCHSSFLDMSSSLCYCSDESNGGPGFPRGFEADPVSWTVQGSVDGFSWFLLDEQLNYPTPTMRASPTSWIYFAHAPVVLTTSPFEALGSGDCVDNSLSHPSVCTTKQLRPNSRDRCEIMCERDRTCQAYEWETEACALVFPLARNGDVCSLTNIPGNSTGVSWDFTRGPTLRPWSTTNVSRVTRNLPTTSKLCFKKNSDELHCVYDDCPYMVAFGGGSNVFNGLYTPTSQFCDAPLYGKDKGRWIGFSSESAAFGSIARNVTQWAFFALSVVDVNVRDSPSYVNNAKKFNLNVPANGYIAVDGVDTPPKVACMTEELDGFVKLGESGIAFSGAYAMGTLDEADSLAVCSAVCSREPECLLFSFKFTPPTSCLRYNTKPVLSDAYAPDGMGNYDYHLFQKLCVDFAHPVHARIIREDLCFSTREAAREYVRLKGAIPCDSWCARKAPMSASTMFQPHEYSHEKLAARCGYKPPCQPCIYDTCNLIRVVGAGIRSVNGLYVPSHRKCRGSDGYFSSLPTIYAASSPILGEDIPLKKQIWYGYVNEHGVALAWKHNKGWSFLSQNRPVYHADRKNSVITRMVFNGYVPTNKSNAPPELTCARASATCPESHPWVFRPACLREGSDCVGFDVCCRSDKDCDGWEGRNSAKPLETRASCCWQDDFVRCPFKPCMDFGGGTLEEASDTQPTAYVAGELRRAPLCVDRDDNSLDVFLNDCTAIRRTQNGKLRFDGERLISHVNPPLCLGGNETDRKSNKFRNAHMVECNGGLNQKWRIDKEGNLRLFSTKECLTDKMVDGRQYVQLTSENSCRKWSVSGSKLMFRDSSLHYKDGAFDLSSFGQKTDLYFDAHGRLKDNANSRHCLTVSKSLTISMATCIHVIDNSQKWRIENHTLRCQLPNCCFQFIAGQGAKSAPCRDSTYQKWVWARTNADNGFAYRAKESTSCGSAKVLSLPYSGDDPSFASPTPPPTPWRTSLPTATPTQRPSPLPSLVPTKSPTLQPTQLPRVLLTETKTETRSSLEPRRRRAPPLPRRRRAPPLPRQTRKPFTAPQPSPFPPPTMGPTGPPTIDPTKAPTPLPRLPSPSPTVVPTKHIRSPKFKKGSFMQLHTLDGPKKRAIRQTSEPSGGLTLTPAAARIVCGKVCDREPLCGGFEYNQETKACSFKNYTRNEGSFKRGATCWAKVPKVWRIAVMSVHGGGDSLQVTELAFVGKSGENMNHGKGPTLNGKATEAAQLRASWALNNGLALSAEAVDHEVPGLFEYKLDRVLVGEPAGVKIGDAMSRSFMTDKLPKMVIVEYKYDARWKECARLEVPGDVAQKAPTFWSIIPFKCTDDWA
eukprot:TRINITY_DN6012_c0_g1_i1.p1 TRINITY_DN6012_c0_g1~~TRINITY_DN6012_c0_g1_i1.p1  ORF type:complete len:1745 (+),score=130.28 TRINITY_DN6012_c0_g1_i1:190-5424(+)